jgi:hypothetical protein
MGYIRGMKKPIAVKIEFDIKDVRRALALITGDTMTDDEINETFFDRDPVGVKLGESEMFQMCIAFVALIVADGEPKKETKKSKFQQKLDEIQTKKST